MQTTNIINKDTTLAREIRQWRQDVHTMRTSCTRNRAAILCYFYNKMSSPSTLRTDRQHRACSRASAWCRRHLSASILSQHYHEMSNGALWA